MSTRRSESAEGVCPVCSEIITIYAVGPCDHPVCYRCSTRMRVLCGQMQCAICRVEKPKVLFISHPSKFAEINSAHFLVFRKHKIYFESENLQTAFFELLEHSCSKCEEKCTFRTFAQLRDHMRREHQLFYCDLCVSHLKVFSYGRKIYDRSKLALHRRVGDADDKSHKGHPLCEFCDERFLDNDELVRHLRKDHYFCHFCDADGITNQFYGGYSFLRDHFRDSHYMCEEGECAHVEFTNAFRSDIDLKCHASTAHTGKMRKAQMRQARTLEIDFNLAPRHTHSRRDRDRDRDRDRGGMVTGNDYEEVHQDSRGRGSYSCGRGRGHNYNQSDRKDRETVDTARAISASLADPPPPQAPRRADFPTLDGRSTEPEPEPFKKDSSIQLRENMAKHVARSNKFSVADGSMEEEDFPLLGRQKALAQTQANSAWSFQPQAKDFPSLQGSHAPKTKSKPANTQRGNVWSSKAPTPQADIVHSRPTDSRSQTTIKTSVNSHSLADFPSLGSIGSGLFSSSSKTPQITQSSGGRSQTPSSNYSHTQNNINKDTDDFSTSRSSGQPSGMSGGTQGKQGSRSLAAKETKSKGLPEPVAPNSPIVAKKENMKYETAASSSRPSEDKIQHRQAKSKPTQSGKTKSSKSVEDVFEEEFPSLGGAKKPVDSQPKASNAPSGTKKQAQQQKTKSSTPQQEAVKVTDSMKEIQLESTKVESFQVVGGKKQNVLKNLENQTEKQHLSSSLKGSEEKTLHPPTSSKKAEEKSQGSVKSGEKKEKFEDDFPALGKPATRPRSEVNPQWGPKSKSVKSDDTDSEQFVTVKTKGKKKIKKEKGESKDKTVSESEPTWGYIPDFEPPPAPARPKKEPPALVFKENKENKRDKDVPWGKGSQSGMLEDFPSLYKGGTEDFPGLAALRDQSNMTLASITAGLKTAPPPPPDIADSSKSPSLTEDFPELGTATIPAPPPGLGFAAPTANPPPGFTTWSAAPPPGFTNAETIPPEPEPVVCPEPDFLEIFSYSQPSNFAERNIFLISAVQHHLGDDDEKFKQFKTGSGQFRQGKITASEYYATCIKLIGTDNFSKVFPELLVLLPDIEKQHELLAAHNAAKKVTKKGKSKKEKGSKSAWGAVDEDFSTCPTCRQVMVATDMSAHMEEHNLEADFPMLSAVPANKYGLSAWVKSN